MPPLFAAALVVLLEGLSFGATFPVIGYYTQQLGGDALWVGAMFALLAGPKVITNPLFGRLADALGRRPVLLVNGLGTLAGSLMWAVAPSVGWLAASRGVTGVFGAQAALANTIAADVSPPEKRAAAMGHLGAAFGIAFTLGPVIGGLVGERLSYAAVGWVCAGLQLVSLAIIALALPETRRAGAAASAAAAPEERAMLGRTDILHLLIVTLVMTLGLSSFNSTYQLVTEHSYGFTAQQTGYALGCFGLCAVIVQGGVVRVMVRRFGERAAGMSGMVLMVAGFGLIALRLALPGLWTATVLLAVGSALAVPCLGALLSRRVGAAEQGAINGLNQAFVGLGRAGGAALGGVLYDWRGVTPTYASAAVVVALSLLLFAAPPRAPDVADDPALL